MEADSLSHGAKYVAAGSSLLLRLCAWVFLRWVCQHHLFIASLRDTTSTDRRTHRYRATLVFVEARNQIPPSLRCLALSSSHLRLVRSLRPVLPLHILSNTSV